MKKIIVFSEREEAAFELLSEAQELSRGGEVAALVCRDGGGESEYFRYGAGVLYRAGVALTEVDEEGIAGALAGLVREHGFDIVLVSSTKRGREIAVRLGVRLGAGCVTDVIGLRWEEESLQADRYTLGGNSVATEEVLTPIKVYAVFPYSFAKRERSHSEGGKVIDIPAGVGPGRKKVLERKEKVREAVSLEAADRILAVGKGLEKREDLAMVEELARMLGAEVACTRPLAVDYGWLSEDRVVGLTGKKASPKLYLTLGVSGQIQHLVGVLRAKTIVAINKSPDAPIFKSCDYGIVADLYEAVPRIIEQLKKTA